MRIKREPRRRPWPGCVCSRHQDPSAVRQLQRQKLRTTLDLATRFVPAYQPYRRQFEQADDIEAFLRRLPLTEKEALRRDREAYVTTSARKKAALAMHTSGSVVPLALVAALDLLRSEPAWSPTRG